MLENGKHRVVQRYDPSPNLSYFEWVRAFLLIPFWLTELLYDAVKSELISYTARGRQIEKERKEQQIKDKEGCRIMRMNYLKMVKIHEGIKHK